MVSHGRREGCRRAEDPLDKRLLHAFEGDVMEMDLLWIGLAVPSVPSVPKSFGSSIGLLAMSGIADQAWLLGVFSTYKMPKKQQNVYHL